MNEFERFTHALALTESGDRELAWGDPKQPQKISPPGDVGSSLCVRGADFVACGRWQMHPAWYAEWADPAIQVGWSWDTAFRAALRRFFYTWRTKTQQWERIAMVFHLGASAEARGDWDEAYAARFAEFWDAQTEESKA